MHADVIWLTALTLSLPALSQCEPLFVLMAPNLLRVGTEENVFVEVQEYAGESLSVDIKVMDFPAKTKTICSRAVKLSEENSFQALQEILMPEHYFQKETKQKQYVYLQAIFPKLILEKVIQVSFQSGYIFIQTDRTIYSPRDSVSYRVFALNAGLKPKTCLVSVEVLDPDGIIVGKFTHRIDKKIGNGKFGIPEIASVGTWKIISRIYNTQHISL
ncbi:hypothetical protein GJAV_G00265910 [Gymnothorax javanicus]|nr:hypothetical protein GJAV_G00265910 [Gymnothorax javanicus]